MTTSKQSPEQGKDKITTAGAVELEEHALDQASGGFSRRDPALPTGLKTPSVPKTTAPDGTWDISANKTA